MAGKVDNARTESDTDRALAITVQPNLGGIDLAYGEIRFAPDGSYLAIGNGDQIKLWETASGRPFRVLEHTAYFQEFTFIANGAQILSVHKDGKVRTWDPATGRMLNESASLELEYVTSISEHPGGQSVLIVSSGGITVWNHKQRRVRAEFQLDNARDATLSDDGKTVIAAGEGTVTRFAVGASQPAKTISLPGVEALKLIGAEFVVSKTASEDCGADVVIAILSNMAAEQTTVDTAPGCPEADESDDGSPGQITLSHNEAEGMLYITRRGVETVKVVDLKKLRQSAATATATSQLRGRVLAIDKNGTLAAIEDGKALRVVRLADGSLVSRMAGHDHENRFYPVASADGRRMMLIDNRDEETQFSVWPVEGVTPVFSNVRLPPGYVARHAVPDANVMLADDEKGQFIVLSTLTGQQISSFSIPAMEGIGLARLSPNGEHALLSVSLRTPPNSDESEGSVLLVRTGSGQIECAFGAPPQGVKACGEQVVEAFAFSADARSFAVGRGPGAEIWTVEQPKLVKRLNAGITEDERQETSTSLKFSPDNKYLINGSRDGGIYIWNVKTGKLQRNLERDTMASHVSTGGLAISHDSKFVAAGPLQRATSSGDIGRERRVQVWELATGKLRFLLSGHEANVNAIAFTQDKRWLVSGSNDGSIRYWHRPTGALGATFAVADGRWAIVTDQGFFAASANAGDLLSVVRGFKATGIDQLWQSLYAPDLVREALAGDSSGEVLRAANVINLDKVLDSGAPPKINITSPAPNAKSADEIITAQATVTAQEGGGIGRVEWRVNGITAGVSNPAPGSGGSVTLTQTLALDPGENKVEVVAYNGRNVLASVAAETTVTWTGTATAKPKLHALVIGINTYIDEDGFKPLKLAVPDAEAFGKALEKAGQGLYEQVRVRTVLDEEATSAKLDALVTEMAADIAPRDTFVLYAAAHGYSEEGRFYLIPQDYRGGPDPDALAELAIDQLKLQDWIANRIRAKKALILLDTCESGALTAGHARSRFEGPASDAAIGRLHEATGRPVLTAAGLGQSALGVTELGHGIFTSAVIDSFRRGDADGNGVVSLMELVAHVQDLVPKLVKDPTARKQIELRGSVGGEQSARFGSRGEDFAFVQRVQ